MCNTKHSNSHRLEPKPQEPLINRRWDKKLKSHFAPKRVPPCYIISRTIRANLFALSATSLKSVKTRCIIIWRNTSKSSIMSAKYAKKDSFKSRHLIFTCVRNTLNWKRKRPIDSAVPLKTVPFPPLRKETASFTVFASIIKKNWRRKCNRIPKQRSLHAPIVIQSFHRVAASTITVKNAWMSHMMTHLRPFGILWLKIIFSYFSLYNSFYKGDRTPSA